MDILQHPYLKISPKLFYRYVAFIGLLRGKFSFSEFVGIMLPGGMKSAEVGARFQIFFNEYQAESVKRKFANADGSMTIYGHPFYGPLYGESLILIEQVIVRDQYDAKRFIKDGDVVIDAGANIGTFSIKVAHDFPAAKIYAVEPSAETFTILKKNVEHYPQVVCVNDGLGDAEEMKAMEKYRDQLGTARIDGSSLTPHDPKLGEIIKEIVTLTTIDALVKRNNISRVDFIKMDTEGYEAKILNGARETIARWKPVIAMSAYHAPGDKTELPAILKSICPEYICELHTEAEEDFVCYVDKGQ